MDDLDRVQQTEEEMREFEEERHGKGKPTVSTDTPKHSITIIGCIKTETGWYKLGFDEETRRMIPLEKS